MAKPQQKKTQQPVKKAVIVNTKHPVEKKFNIWLALAAVLPITFIVFTPILNNRFTNWDDPTYIIDNPLIRSLDWSNVKRIFSEFYFGNYQPLHIFSYALEYHFFKLDPPGYHAVSLVMHVVVTGLVLWLIYVLCKNGLVAVIAALLFGLHPLHVESVAWAAERKDLLYAIFFILAMICYLKYLDEGWKAKFYVLALLFFSLSILSKAMASSLPPVLILLDYFRGRKFSIRLVMEKIPFFAIAVVMGLISITAAESTETISHDQVFSFFDRILFACHNLLSYTYKLILPLNLSSFYPYPLKEDGVLPFYYYLAPILIAGLLFLTIRSMRSTKIVFFATGFFVVCLFLVLQLLPVGPTIMSERYSYVPSIAVFYLIGVGTSRLIEKKRKLIIPVYALLAAYSIFLAVTTYKRCDVWKDSLTLWTNVLDQFPNISMAFNNRGNIYGRELGQLDKALEDYNKSIFFDPNYINAYSNRGIVYSMQGKFEPAIEDFTKALALKPNYAEALQNRGLVYAQTGRTENAIADFTAVLQIDKNDPGAYINRGTAYTRSGQFEKALDDFNKALLIKSDYADAYYGRSAALYNLKKYYEAYQDVQMALSLGFKIDQKYVDQISKAAGK